jgi:RHS repeat-associated protein
MSGQSSSLERLDPRQDLLSLWIRHATTRDLGIFGCLRRSIESGGKPPHSQGSTPDSSGNIVYYMSDQLGTSRVVASAAGAILDESDFYPFGGERVVTTSSGNHYKFTRKERDSESGLDNFGARYMSSMTGRFMSPDPVVITPERFYDPQQLNAFAYVRNNPTRLVDPTGMILQLSGDTEVAKNDLCQIVGADLCSRITVDDKTGVVSFDTKDLDLSGNAGAALVNDLVQSQSTYDFSAGPTVETAGGTVKVDFIKNLPPSPDQIRYRKCQCPADTETPKKGVDDQIAFNPNGQRNQISLTNLQLAVPAMSREETLRDQRPYLKEHNPSSGGDPRHPDNAEIIKK